MYNKEYHKEYRKKYISRKHVLERNRRQEHKQMSIDYLGGKCKDCGNPDNRVLVFDHVTNDKVCNISHLYGKKMGTN